MKISASNQRIKLPLIEFTIVQKLDLMETLWTDLSKDEGEMPSPAWHKAVLKEREERIRNGKITVLDWEKTKTDLRKHSV